MAVLTLMTIVALTLVVIDVMSVDRDAAIHAAADPLSDRRDIATRSDNASRRNLRDVDGVALRIRRHRMRAR